MVEQYERPRKFNSVSILIILILASIVYGVVQFGPPYYRKWKVKGILSEAANKIYPQRFLTDDNAGSLLEKIRTWTYTKLRGVGITDPGLRVHISKTNDLIGAGADYTERIKHPLIKKTTVLHFRPYNSLRIKN